MSLSRIGKKYGYSLVCAENKGVNLFFVRDDVLEQCPFTFKNINDVAKLYKYPKYSTGPNGGHKEDPLVKVQAILKQKKR